MKRAVSISLGSSSRDKKVEVHLDNQVILVERISSQTLIGDLMFMFGLPVPVRGLQNFKRLARVLLPLAGYLPISIENLSGKTVVTNTTTEEDIQLLKKRGVHTVITTTPRYDGRSFGINVMEAVLTAYAGLGRPLSIQELNHLIDELDLRPNVQFLMDGFPISH